MKKLSLNYLFAIALLGTVFLASCDKDDPEPSTPAATVNTYKTILLGNQNNASDPSFYSSSTDTRYKLADAKSNAASVDFGYGNGAASGNEYFIGSPDDESMKAVYSDATNGIEKWSKINSTRFKLATLTSAQFDTLTKESALVAAVAAGADPLYSTRVRGTEIEANDVIAFTTGAGKRGLFKVVARSGTSSASGSITLDVKVQK